MKRSMQFKRHENMHLKRSHSFFNLVFETLGFLSSRAL